MAAKLMTSDEVVTLFSANLPQTVADTADIFSYQGFDPLYTATKLKAKCTAANVPFQDYIGEISIAIAVRGTKLVRGQEPYNKSSDSAKAKLDAFQTLWEIKAGKPTSKEDVTYGRIAAVAAPMITRLYQKGVGRIVGTVEVGLATGLHHPGGAAMCTSETELKLWVKWAKSFATIVKSDPAQVETYATVLYGSRLLTIAQRQAFRAKFQIQ